MPNLFDYLSWRGDLPLTASSLNPVDSLILCCLSYIQFQSALDWEKEVVTIAQAANEFLALPQRKRIVRAKEDELLLKKMASSRRYSGLRLIHYVSRLDSLQEKQFGAVTILLEGGGLFVSFRGTDNTIVGWKEDFNMVFLPTVPAQQDAVMYLEEIATSFSGDIWTGGHSKGGNLAVYAAARSHPSTQQRICGVYNNDGPGFGPEMLESGGYMAIRNRIHTFLPQTSIVGMLLEHEEDYTVVHSKKIGPLQHDPYSWEVTGPQFIMMVDITYSSQLIDRTLKDWVAGMDGEQREHFVDGLFHLFSAGNVQTFAEMRSLWVKNIGMVLQSWRDTSPETRRLLLQTLIQLLDAASKNLLGELPSRFQFGQRRESETLDSILNGGSS